MRCSQEDTEEGVKPNVMIQKDIQNKKKVVTLKDIRKFETNPPPPKNPGYIPYPVHIFY